MQTDFQDKVSILAHLWVWYRDEDSLKDFFEFNDIGLPLAYFVSEKLATPLEQGSRFIDDTFDMFLQAIELEDTGFKTLDEIFEAASYFDR
jgi:hypothetical protein